MIGNILRVSISIIFSSLVLGFVGAFAAVGATIMLLAAGGFVLPLIIGVLDIGLLYFLFAPIISFISGSMSFNAMLAVTFLAPTFLYIALPIVGIGFLAGATYGIYCGAVCGISHFKNSLYAGLLFPLNVAKSFFKVATPLPDVMTHHEIEEIVEKTGLQRITCQMKDGVSKHGMDFFNVFQKHVPIPYDIAKTVIEYAINAKEMIFKPYYSLDFPTTAFNIKHIIRMYPITYIIHLPQNRNVKIYADIVQRAKDRRNHERSDAERVQQEELLIDKISKNDLLLKEESDGTTQMIWKMFNKAVVHTIHTTDTMLDEVVEEAVDNMTLLMKKDESEQPKARNKINSISFNERRANGLVLSWLGTSVDSQIMELEAKSSNLRLPSPNIG